METIGLQCICRCALSQKFEIQTRFAKIHMKITNFIGIKFEIQTRFVKIHMNFCKTSLNVKFCDNAHLLMHYWCA
jgi:hypothetical protein